MSHQPASMSQVRALAKEFARGEISRENYREQRAELVRRIIAGELEIEYKLPRLPEDTDPAGSDNTEFLMDIGDDVFDAPQASYKKPVLIGIAAVAILALVAGGWWLFNPPSAGPAAGSVEQVATPPGESLLKDFLAHGDWSHATLDTLEMEWKILAAEEREAARSSVYWRRFQNRLRERINEQEVLANYDESGDAAEAAERLKALQATLNDQD